MRFDLFLQGFKNGDASPTPSEGVLQVLRKHCRDTADRFGYYNVNFADGSSVELSASGIELDAEFRGCSLHLRQFSPPLIAFIFDLAQSGGMVILSAQGDPKNPANPIVILTDAQQASELPSGITDYPVLCQSPEHLAELLGVGFKDWVAYRDHVLR